MSLLLLPTAGRHGARKSCRRPWGFLDASLRGEVLDPLSAEVARVHTRRPDLPTQSPTIIAGLCWIATSLRLRFVASPQRMPGIGHRRRGRPVVNVIYRVPPRRDWLQHRRYLAVANLGEHPVAGHCTRENRYPRLMPFPRAPIHHFRHVPAQTTPSRTEFQGVGSGAEVPSACGPGPLAFRGCRERTDAADARHHHVGGNEVLFRGRGPEICEGVFETVTGASRWVLSCVVLGQSDADERSTNGCEGSTWRFDLISSKG